MRAQFLLCRSHAFHSTALQTYQFVFLTHPVMLLNISNCKGKSGVEMIDGEIQDNSAMNGVQYQLFHLHNPSFFTFPL